MRITKLMKLHRLMDKAGEHGSDAGGSGTGSDAGAAGSDSGNAGDKGESGNTAGDETGKKADEGKADEKGDQKSTLSDTDAKLVKDLMKHKGRAKELEDELAKTRSALKDYEGIDPVKVRTLLQQQEEAERKELEARGEYDRLIKQMAERHTEEKKRLETEMETVRAQGGTLQQQIAELTVGSAFSSSHFVAEEITLTPAKARVIYGAHFEFKDGKVVGYDKPAGASDRTTLVDATGESLSFDEAMRQLINADPDREQLIRAKAKPGASSSTSSKGAAKAVTAAAARQESKLSPAEKITAGLKALATG